MKKLSVILLALATAIIMSACTSVAQMQEAINASFNKVYTTYADALVLDGAETYEVKSGDTLTAITKSHYGDDKGYYFPLIMLASRDVVKDPELIAPGMQLTIPNFDANINDKEVAKKLSPYFKDLAGVYKQKRTEAAPDIRKHLLEISDELAK